jgi:hypothetical protein
MTGANRLFSITAVVTREGIQGAMLPFLHLHALAATRGDGLRPELRILFERLAEASEAASKVAIANDRHLMDVIGFSSGMVSSEPSGDARKSRIKNQPSPEA